MTLPALLLALVILSAAWSTHALPGVVSLTTEALEACQTLFVRCVEIASVAKLFFFWSGGLLLSGGLICAFFRAIQNILAAKRAISALRIKHNNGSARS